LTLAKAAILAVAGKSRPEAARASFIVAEARLPARAFRGRFNQFPRFTRYGQSTAIFLISRTIPNIPQDRTFPGPIIQARNASPAGLKGWQSGAAPPGGAPPGPAPPGRFPPKLRGLWPPSLKVRTS